MNLLLLVALLASCLYLVKTSYEARRLFASLDRAKAEQVLLDTESKRLDAERQAQATHLRVEKVAREKLHMRTATPAVTQYVFEGGAASAPEAGIAAVPPQRAAPSPAATPASAGSEP
jgi:cell division protein FtsL